MSNYRDALGQHAILRRITGLKTVQFKSRPGRYASSAEAYARKDQNSEGEFIEDFSSNVIPGAVTGLAPFWNDLKDTYWVEDIRILQNIVRDGPIRIRYPNNHPESPGKLIKPEDIDPRNYWDYFFQSDDLKMKRMSGGKYTFELQKDPIDTLLYYCYSKDPRVLVKSGTEISKYVVGRAQYELTIPRNELLEDSAELKKEINTLGYLGNMSYEKQKHIARVMKLRLNDFENPDPDSLIVELGKAARKKDKVPRWGMSHQDKFSTLAEMSNEDLMLNLDIVKALETRVLTVERNDYLMNSEVLEGVIDEVGLFHFFKRDNNSEKYKDLSFLLEEKAKKGKTK